MEVERRTQKERPTSVGPAVVGLSRCPFCHDAIGLETTEWVACQRCLARHHDGCWDEASGCSACGATRALTKRQPAPRRAFAAPAALLLGALIGLGAGAFVGLRARTTVAAPEEAPVPVLAQAQAPEQFAHVPAHVWERLDFLLSEGRTGDARRFVGDMIRRYPAGEAELLRALAPHDRR